MSDGRWLVRMDLWCCLLGLSSTFAFGAQNWREFSHGLGLGVLTATAFRAALVLTALANEWGHLLVARALGGKATPLDRKNLLGQRPFSVHLCALFVGFPDRRGDLTVRVVVDARWLALVKRGGFLAGAALCLGAASALLLATDSLPAAACLCGTVLALGGAFVTDMTDWSPYGRHGHAIACGNVTLLGKVASERASALPGVARRLLFAMLRVSQMRGAQSGGAAVQVQQAGYARQRIEKCVNTKRGDLPRSMTALAARAARGKQPPGSSFLVQAHVRYATAGMTTKHEAHPFCYVDPDQRGPRRVTSWQDGKPVVVSKPIETVLTHNGDMEGLRFRGMVLEFGELGAFFERVLGVKNRWRGDSPLLAAAIDLYVAQGMWQEALRLAYYLVVAPASRQPVVLDPAELTAWERLAEVTLEGTAARWQSPSASGLSRRRFREQLIDALVAAFETAPSERLSPGRLPAFVRTAVDAFFDNDLYVALRKLEPALLGTFGCVVTSTLAPGSFVALSRGQPLSLGFHRPRGLACAASERAALKVQGTDERAAFEERLDLDLCRGEIARVTLDTNGTIQLVLYGISDGREFDAAELIQAGRLVPLEDNPYVTPLPHEARDRVGADVQALPGMLHSIRARWTNDADYNVATAHRFRERLFESERPRLLILGITNDLWIGEQFAKNLMLAFPGVSATSRSSNEILGAEARQSIETGTVVLAVSQTGQDFPTLAALLLLQAEHPGLGDRTFVLTGELDSLMGQAVGQSYARGAPFSARIFANGSGFRPSEANLLPVSALQHTFCELLLFLMRSARPAFAATTPCALSPPDVEALATCRDQTIDRHLPASSGEIGAPEGKALRRVARRFSWHVLEWIVAFLLSLCVLELNVGLGLELLPSTALSALTRLLVEPHSGVASALDSLARQLDVVFYAFLTPLFVWLLRAVQGRPLLHRQGVRELLIADSGYVHRVVWLFTRRLFASSYGFAAIKAYSADAQDELVLTHEPVRGTLVLLGLPDRRGDAPSAGAAAAAMSAKQFHNSRSLGGSGAEIVTIGRGPGISGLGQHVTLPGDPLGFTNPVAVRLVEGMFASWERLVAMQLVVERMAHTVSRLPFARFDRSRTKDQVFAPTTAAPVSAAAIYQLLSRSNERYDGEHREPLPFEVSSSDWRGSAPKVRTTFWTPDGRVLD